MAKRATNSKRTAKKAKKPLSGSPSRGRVKPGRASKPGSTASARAGAGRAAGRSGRAKVATKKAASADPRPVNTGAGATPAEIGADLVALFNGGRADEIEAKWWSPDIVSVEGRGVGLEWHGRHAVEGKQRDWMSKHTMLGGAAEGPFVGSTGFAVKFRLHVREHASGAERHVHEVGVYTVSGGRIVREEFMYAVE